MTASLPREQKEGGLGETFRRLTLLDMLECEPSRFLDELPADDLEWSGRDSNLSDDEKKERGRGHLAGLRNLLATD